MPPCRALTRRRAALQEGVLWSALAVLSLLAGLATGTLQTWHHNRSLGAAPTPGGLRSPSSGEDDSTEPPLATAWSQLYGRCRRGRGDPRAGWGEGVEGPGCTPRGPSTELCLFPDPWLVPWPVAGAASAVEPGPRAGKPRPPGLTPRPVFAGDNVTAGAPGEAQLAEDLLLRAERSPLAPARAEKARKKPGQGGRGRNCHIRSLMVKVRDLGLGFNSDEIVLFKYCSGSCHRARTNYDLTLASLLRQQVIAPRPQDRVVSHPCCRPTRYEAVSFMDVQNTWQTVEKLSAAECSCIG